MERSVCVFCSSSDALDRPYFEAASDLGRRLAVEGFALVYGGTTTGLMGAVARAAGNHGGKVVGVIPEVVVRQGIANHDADELIQTRDLRERKAIMDQRAGAFVALPGGFGTLEEVLEVIALKQLQVHARPILFLNTLGFYDGLAAFLERLFVDRFTKAEYRNLYQLVPDPAALMEALRNYTPPAPIAKWY